ncbi:MAG: hypothetical protein MMC23_002716 [Stictis urceolatum]|nr:hypothetical protein [Stictis urceolata]
MASTSLQLPSDLQHSQPTSNGYGQGPGIVSTTGDLEIICGPLLNYKHLANPDSETPTWSGSVLVVTKSGQRQPTLSLKKSTQDVILDSRTDRHAVTNGVNGVSSRVRNFEAVRLYADPDKTFWVFPIDLPLGPSEARWEYTIPNVRYAKSEIQTSKASQSFVVPAAMQSMRIMFHSCNGFSVGTDEEAYSGPALWNDVNRMHRKKPFHVMIGGGDQIYNDGIRVDGPLKEWTSIANPIKRREYPFGERMRADCDEYYYQNYVRWYSTEPFSSANGAIPQINIWDDHDIIDGFGSYTDHFMKCHVFRGIGGVAFKYYCLFQHHIPPPKYTFTTDAPQATKLENLSGPAADPKQLKDTFVMTSEIPDQSFIIGQKPGPYVEEVSRSLYARLGSTMAFVGIDARTERTRHQVNYPETYDLIFDRLDRELSASSGKVKHLIVLLGVPIAYPRLAWLENLFTSPIMGPIRLLNKRFGVAGGLFNQFDGNIDLLDDLDDHYTARQHKAERRNLMHRLQVLSQTHSVRVTILGGDVHLAALGRFYSKLKLDIPAEQDHRYMANVISSAITNKPPPKAVANLLARRNRIHHLDHDTDETLMNFFDKDPGNSSKTASSNHATMPSRNYAIIQETPGAAPSNGVTDGAHLNGVSTAPKTKPKDGHGFLHAGEEGAGTQHAAASGLGPGNFPGGLDVSIRVEIDQHDREGKTEGYGFSSEYLQVDRYDFVLTKVVPSLHALPKAPEREHHFRLHHHSASEAKHERHP